MSVDDHSLLRVERQTMAVFSRENPTKRAYAVGDPEFDGLRRREETILANLGLDPNDFAGKHVLDAGCGTGEVALLAASWGATVWAFDLNPASVQHAVSMAMRTGLSGRCRVVVGNVLAPPWRGPFDIVLCLGVLAHVGSPRTGFAELSKLLRPGGILYVSHINRYGFVLRRLKRAVVHLLSGGHPERKARWAKVLWSGHIERAARFGYRTKDQIAWDNFVAPHVSATIADWLHWIEENRLEYVASFPSFYSRSLRPPPSQTGGLQRVTPARPPESGILRTFLPLVAQLRWALAFGVGGCASISFLARRPVMAQRARGD